VSYNIAWFVAGLMVGLAAACVLALAYWRRRQGERQDQTQHLEAALAARERDLVELEGQLAEQRARAGQLRDQVQGGQERIGMLESGLQARQEALRPLQLQLAVREDQIQALQAELEAAGTREAALATVAEDEKARAAYLRRRLSEIQKKLYTMEAEWEERDQLVGRLRLMVSARERQVEGLRDELAIAESLAADLAARLQQEPAAAE
jgi:chromosome segregation ATPase